MDEMTWIRNLARERQQYVNEVGTYPPVLVAGSFLSQFLGERIAAAIDQGIPWPEQYDLGDPAGPGLLAEMRRKLPIHVVERQLARADYKVRFGLDRGASARDLAANLEGTIYALGFDPDSPEYPGGPLPGLPDDPAAAVVLMASEAPLTPPGPTLTEVVTAALADNRVTAAERAKIRAAIAAEA